LLNILPLLDMSLRRLATGWYPGIDFQLKLRTQYMKRQSARFGFKPEQIVVIGSSAGGLLASLLATISPNDPLGANELLEEPDTVPYGVVGYCPVTTLFNKRETIEALMGCPLGSEDALYRQASPVCRIKGKEPPFLLLQGDSDTITPLAHVKAFHHTLLEHGAVSELIVFEGVNHGFGYGTATEAQRKSLAAIQAFVEKMTSSCT
jgi:acetyl esterase/lipase